MQSKDLQEFNQKSIVETNLEINLDNILFVDFHKSSGDSAAIVKKINRLFYSLQYSFHDLSRIEILTRGLLEDKDVIGFSNIEGITYLGAVIVNHFLKEIPITKKVDFKISIDQLLLYNSLKVNNKFVGETKLSAIITQLESNGNIKLDDNWELPINYLPAILKEIQGYITGETILRLLDDKNLVMKLEKKQEQIVAKNNLKKNKKIDLNPYSRCQRKPLEVSLEAKRIFKMLLYRSYDDNERPEVISEDIISEYILEEKDNSRKRVISQKLSQYKLKEEVIKYTPLIIKIAKKIKRRTFYTELDDLISEGYIGLLDGLRLYDTNISCDIKHYLILRITGAIYDSLRRADVLSQRERRNVKRYNNAVEKVSAVYGEVTDELIAEELGVEIDDRFFQSKKSASYKIVYYNDYGNYSGYRNIDIIDILINKSIKYSACGHVIDEEVDNQNILGYLAVTIASLPEDKKELFLNLYSGLTQAEISRSVGLTQARISQEIAMLIPFIKRRLNNYMLMYILEF